MGLVTATDLNGRAGPWVGLLALGPWIAFMLAVPVADWFVEYNSVYVPGFLRSALFYLGWVSLPSLLPIAAARPGTMRTATTTLMSVVAAIAGVVVATSRDAQGGLAVFIVLYVALPLAAILWLARRLLTGTREARTRNWPRFDE